MSVTVTNLATVVDLYPTGVAATDYANLNGAILALNALGGGEVRLGRGTFLMSATPKLRSKVDIKGAGLNATTIKLADSANTDVLATLTNVDTYIDTGDIAHGESYIKLSDFTIDGNKANNSSGKRGLACYWYKNYLENIAIINCKTYGIYEGWGAFGLPSPLIDMTNTYQNVSIANCDGTDQWYHSGPHDSRGNACTIGCGNATSNLHVGTYGTGMMMVNSHSYAELGVRQPAWSVIVDGEKFMWDNCTAEGGSTGQIKVRAPDCSISGGIQYCINSAYAQIGVQIGDTANGFTNVAGYSIKTRMLNFSTATVAFDSDGGLGQIDIRGFNTAASTLYTGTPSATSNISIQMDGTGSGYFTRNAFPVPRAALATNAVDGFLYVPTCAGMPTGTPTAYTGRIPLIVDSTNSKLYFYSGGAWKDAGP